MPHFHSEVTVDGTLTASVSGGDISGSLPSPTVVQLQGRAVSATAPSNNNVLTWNGTTWVPATPSGITRGVAMAMG